MEEQWTLDRARLRDLLLENPQYPRTELAARLGRSLSWVYRWIPRLIEADPSDDRLIQRRPCPPQSRTAPKQQPKIIARMLDIRDHPPANLQRVPGPKTIRYFLLQGAKLQADVDLIPRSTRTIWRILRQHGRIPTPSVAQPQPLERADPLQVWQMDFKTVTSVPPDPDGKQQHVVEILNVVDTGTSLLVDSLPRSDYNASTALLALAQVLLLNGRPRQITFDRDPRFIGSWTGQDFPSALVRFLLCLGIRPDVLPPRRPDKNGFVERFHRSLDAECLRIHQPVNLEQTESCTLAFRWHYNTERPNQARSCGNQPPLTAFPNLPSLPAVPDLIDPDRWLSSIHGKLYKRRVDHYGSVLVNNLRYYVGQKLRGRYVLLKVDANSQEFAVLLDGQCCKRLPIKGLYNEWLDFGQYLKFISQEALSEWQKWKHNQRKVRRFHERE